MTEPRHEDLIYDWNVLEAPPRPEHRVEFDDETLRDGLQSPSVRTPTVGQKIEILHKIASLGIDSVNLGLPGAGAHAVRDVEALAREIVRTGMKIDPNCAARTLEADIRPIAEIQQRTGLSLESAVFLGSSQIRLLVEEWDIKKLLKLTIDAVTFAKAQGLRVMYVTEDTTRTHPEIVDQLYRAAIEHGATRVVVCDTVGHATPHGVAKLVRFVKSIIRETNPAVKLDWHGHRDRGLDVINSITAYEAGADRLHGAGIGIGERAGNTPMDTLLVNMKLLGYITEAGGQPIVPATKPVKNHFEGVEEAVELALNQELKVTEQINNLVSVADSEKDYLSHQFLQWFVVEQLEEVSSMSALLNIVRRAGSDLFRVEDYLSRNPHEAEAGGGGA